MAHTVSSECVACGACVDTCPVGAITMEDKAVVDAASCVDCGACEGVCPTGAIQAEYATLAHPARPPGKGGRAFFIAMKKQPFPGKTAFFYWLVGEGFIPPGEVSVAAHRAEAAL